LKKRLYYWIFGAGLAGGIVALLLILMLWFGSNYAYTLLVCLDRIPIELSVWMTDNLLTTEAIAPTREQIIFSDFIIVIASITQWALIGAVVGVLVGLIKRKGTGA
jgi:hypothetical protein